MCEQLNRDKNYNVILVASSLANKNGRYRKCQSCYNACKVCPSVHHVCPSGTFCLTLSRTPTAAFPWTLNPLLVSHLAPWAAWGSRVAE